jgi:pteridine reductase
MDMSNKVILITGAGRRTGQIIAEWFAARGHDIAVHYGTSEHEAAQTVARIVAVGRKAIAIQADLADAAQIHALVDRTFAYFGRLDLLVNCASRFEQDHFADFDLADFDLAWAVNARAPLLLTRAFYLRAKAAGATGAVVNIVDQKVRNNFHADHFSYTVGKAALGNMTQMLAMSAHPVLRVNAIYPGLMLPSGDQTDEDFAYASRQATPLERVAHPEDLAAAIDLLSRPACNGVDLVVDGGQNLRRVDRDVLYLYRDPGRGGSNGALD